MPARKASAVRKTSFAAPSGRQAERTALTRARLLRAAEKIFARDGFEAAKLEEIAAEAGYTRGAFYANFASKEELFITMLGEETERRMQGLGRLLEIHKPAARLAALREHFIGLSRDHTWNMLFLEFKLFLLRRPEMRAKALEMQTRTFATVVAALDAIYDSLGIRLPVSTLAAATAWGAIANTLGLDLQIGRAITEREADAVMTLFFEAMTGVG
jgi:AcrR family transcriptional regulator